jgi:hypothetical protein
MNRLFGMINVVHCSRFSSTALSTVTTSAIPQCLISAVISPTAGYGSDSHGNTLVSETGPFPGPRARTCVFCRFYILDLEASPPALYRYVLVQILQELRTHLVWQIHVPDS